MILPIGMTKIDFDLVDLNQVSGRITDCRVDPEAFNGDDQNQKTNQVTAFKDQHPFRNVI